jgi:O-methyltransferase domain/Dimerisation domain
MADVTPDPIMRIALGFMAAKHLFVATAIGLFERLAGGPATLDELAAASGVPRRTLRISADAMVSLGLLEREGGRYRNSAAAAAFLAGGPGPDPRPMLRFWDKLSYPAWLNLESAVRNGAGQAGFFQFNEEEQQIFSAGVEAFSAPAAAALSAAYDFGRHRRVLDVARGTGSFLITILRHHATLRSTLFQLPGTCAVARRRLAREPQGARIEVTEGDLLKDPLPNGHDVVIAANIVHALSEVHNLDLLRNVRTHVTAARGYCSSICGWMRAGPSLPPAR